MPPKHSVDVPASKSNLAGLPSFQSSGRLPPGVYDFTLDGLAALTCFNPHRRKMWKQLINFLVLPSLVNDFSYAYVGGGFLSTNSHPDDIDLVLQTKRPYGPESFAVLSRFFATGLGQIQAVYGIHLHFWIENAPQGVCDFRIFFQYERPKAIKPSVDPACGVAKLDLTAPDLLESLRSYLRDEQS
jgi:hypothetical protein